MAEQRGSFPSMLLKSTAKLLELAIECYILVCTLYVGSCESKKLILHWHSVLSNNWKIVNSECFMISQQLLSSWQRMSQLITKSSEQYPISCFFLRFHTFDQLPHIWLSLFSFLVLIKPNAFPFQFQTNIPFRNELEATTGLPRNNGLI